jgi:hypothetical protein
VVDLSGVNCVPKILIFGTQGNHCSGSFIFLANTSKIKPSNRALLSSSLIASISSISS